MRYFLWVVFLSSGLLFSQDKDRDNSEATCFSLLAVTSTFEYDEQRYLADIQKKFPPGSEGEKIISEYIASLHPQNKGAKTFIYHFEEGDLVDFSTDWTKYTDAAVSSLLLVEKSDRGELLSKRQVYLKKYRKVALWAAGVFQGLWFVSPTAAVITTGLSLLSRVSAGFQIQENSKELKNLTKDPRIERTNPKPSIARTFNVEMVNCGSCGTDKVARLKWNFKTDTALRFNNEEERQAFLREQNYAKAYEVKALVYFSAKPYRTVTVVLSIDPEE